MLNENKQHVHISIMHHDNGCLLKHFELIGYIQGTIDGLGLIFDYEKLLT